MSVDPELTGPPIEPHERLRKHRIMTSSCNICCHTCFLIAIIVVLAIDHNSCHYPIRAWLIVYAVLSIVGTICSLIIEIFSSERFFGSKILSRFYVCYYFTMIIFFVTWTILGSVWVYVDDHCKQGNHHIEFELGWKLLVAILAIQYILFIVCSFAGCVGCVYSISISYLRRQKKAKEQVEMRESH